MQNYIHLSGINFRHLRIISVTTGSILNRKEDKMANDKKLVEAITAMEDDFAQWYTDVVKKAELMGYSSVKGCMIFKPAGYAIWENIQHELDRRFKETGVENICQCLFLKVF